MNFKTTLFVFLYKLYSATKSEFLEIVYYFTIINRGDHGTAVMFLEINEKG